MNILRSQFDRHGKGRIAERVDSPADAIAGFEDHNAHTRARQIRRGGQSRGAGPDYDHVGIVCSNRHESKTMIFPLALSARKVF